MATYSSILTWRIPWTEEPGGQQPIESQRAGRDWSDIACVQACGNESCGILLVTGDATCKQSLEGILQAHRVHSLEWVSSLTWSLFLLVIIWLWNPVCFYQFSCGGSGLPLAQHPCSYWSPQCLKSCPVFLSLMGNASLFLGHFVPLGHPIIPDHILWTSVIIIILQYCNLIHILLFLVLCTSHLFR